MAAVCLRFRSIVLFGAARLVVLALAGALPLLSASPAGAHETDQYTLPIGRDFADLRYVYSRMAYDAIHDAVQFTNSAIRASLRDGRPTAETAPLQSGDFIAHEVWANLFAAIPTNEIFEAEQNSEAMHARYPGLILLYTPDQYIYSDPLLLIDLTKIVRTFFRSGTLNAGGTLFGTDKLLHFIHMGRIYHTRYLEARAEGLDEQAAVTRAVEVSLGAHPILSEHAMLGSVSTGIYSNADLAADYSGLKFYRNLTEPVRMGEVQLPPMLVRDGPYWRLDARVRPGSDFFAAFITPHFNEALNPNSYLSPIRPRVRKMLLARCYDLLDWYRDEHGNVRTREQFLALEKSLSTFYGEPYGYENDGEDTVSIATTCFAPDGSPVSIGDTRAAPANMPSVPPPGLDGDGFGRTSLWWAARTGRVDEVKRLLAATENPNARDVDGETPLHAAARFGHAAVVELLIVHGADPNAGDRNEVTPLHLAAEAEQLDVARVLLAHGADPNARDGFGRTPLHEAALRQDRTLAALLLAHGADPALRYGRSTAAQLAARAGNAALAAWLGTVHATPMAKRSPDGR
jgi:Ankyrin repeats (3 copies)/Ankyrin repeat